MELTDRTVSKEEHAEVGPRDLGEQEGQGEGLGMT